MWARHLFHLVDILINNGKVVINVIAFGFRLSRTASGLFQGIKKRFVNILKVRHWKLCGTCVWPQANPIVCTKDLLSSRKRKKIHNKHTEYIWINKPVGLWKKVRVSNGWTRPRATLTSSANSKSPSNFLFLFASPTNIAAETISITSIIRILCTPKFVWPLIPQSLSHIFIVYYCNIYVCRTNDRRFVKENCTHTDGDRSRPCTTTFWLFDFCSLLSESARPTRKASFANTGWNTDDGGGGGGVGGGTASSLVTALFGGNIKSMAIADDDAHPIKVALFKHTGTLFTTFSSLYLIDGRH